MASVVEVTLRGIDEASSVFNNASAEAQSAMSSASQSVDGLSSSVADVPDVDMSTEAAQSALHQAQQAVEGVGSEAEETRGFFGRLKDGAAEAGNIVREHWDKIAIGTGAAGAALEGFARSQGDTNYAFERMGRVTGEGSEAMRGMATDLQNVTFPMEDVTSLMETATKRGLEGDAIADYANFWDMVGDATGEAGPELGKAGVALEMVGISAGNEGEALDAFGYITDNTTSSIGEFLNFTERAGRELGENTPHVNDMAAALGTMEGEGYSARTAQRELQRALRETDGDLDAAMQQLGISSEAWDENRKSVEGSGGAIEANAQAYAESLTPMQKLTAWSENLMTQFGGLAQAAGMLAPVMMGVAAGVSALRGAMQLLGAAGGPIMLIVAAVAALVAGLVIAYKQSETFRNIVQAAWAGVQRAFSAAWDVIKPVIEAIQEWFARTIPPIIERAREIFAQVWDTVSSGLAAAWQFMAPILATLRTWMENYLTVAFQVLQNVAKVVWSAIQMAIQLAWSIIQGIFNTIKWTIEKILAPAFQWLYQNIIRPVWDWISDKIVVAWNRIIKPAFAAIQAFIQNVLGPAFQWLWNNIISPVWDWISSKVMDAWKNTIRPAFDAITSFISGGLGPTFEWLWNNIVSPIFGWIGKHISTTWNNVIRPIFRALGDFIRSPLGSTFRWLWDNIINPVWGWVGDKIRNVWRNFISPAFDALKDGLDGVGRAFDSGVEWIGDAWDGLKRLTKTPVNFIIGTVWNGGIVRLWNSVATKFGASELSTIPKLATGGHIEGPGTSTSDSIPALLSRGEHVISAAEVKAAGGHKTIEELRANFRAGRVPAYRLGGAVDWLKDKGGKAWNAVSSGVSSVGSWVADKAKQAAEFIKSPISWLTDAAERLVKDGGESTGFSDLVGRAPIQIIKDGAEKIKEMVGFGESGGSVSGGIGGPLRAGAWRRPSRGRITSRYGPRPGLAGVTGSAFHNGIDFAGGGATYAARDGRVMATGWNILPTNSGIGILIGHGGGFNTYYGHNPVGGVRVRPGQEVTAGQQVGREGATGNVTGVHLHFGVQKNGRFVNPSITGLFDDGGVLQQGITMAKNATGGPEAVLTLSQWHAMFSLAEYAGRVLDDQAGHDRRHRGDGDGNTTIIYKYQIDKIEFTARDLDEVQDIKDFFEMLKHERKMKRAHERGTKRSGEVLA